MLAKFIRAVQLSLFALLVCWAIVEWRGNQVGQNLINLTAASMYLIGLDQILIFYRWYLSSSSYEYESSLAIFFFLVLGRLFQQYNPSTTAYSGFNLICGLNLVVVLSINALSLLCVLVVLALYLFRQMYRLMTSTLLSADQNIQRADLERLMDTKRPFGEMQAANSAVNNTCSICLFEFEPDNLCIMLPVCKHCFHAECIEEWLNTKATCPYCRYNIRVVID